MHPRDKILSHKNEPKETWSYLVLEALVLLLQVLHLLGEDAELGFLLQTALLGGLPILKQPATRTKLEMKGEASRKG